VLPAAHRMRRSTDFAETIRRGRRVGRRTLVVHLLRPVAAAGGSSTAGPLPAAQVGLVVSRAVGNSVVRHRVSRRLRAVIAPRLVSLPQGTRLVVRALPAGATASSAELASDLEAALDAAGRRPAALA
jgi:ribonuclease P protein component